MSDQAPDARPMPDHRRPEGHANGPSDSAWMDRMSRFPSVGSRERMTEDRADGPAFSAPADAPHGAAPRPLEALRRPLLLRAPMFDVGAGRASTIAPIHGADEAGIEPLPFTPAVPGPGAVPRLQLPPDAVEPYAPTDIDLGDMPPAPGAPELPAPVAPPIAWNTVDSPVLAGGAPELQPFVVQHDAPLVAPGLALVAPSHVGLGELPAIEATPGGTALLDDPSAWNSRFVPVPAPAVRPWRALNDVERRREATICYIGMALASAIALVLALTSGGSGSARTVADGAAGTKVPPATPHAAGPAAGTAGKVVPVTPSAAAVARARALRARRAHVRQARVANARREAAAQALAARRAAVRIAAARIAASRAAGEGSVRPSNPPRPATPVRPAPTVGKATPTGGGAATPGVVKPAPGATTPAPVRATAPTPAPVAAAAPAASAAPPPQGAPPGAA